MDKTLYLYIELINQFLNKKLGTKDFEKKYFNLFKNEKNIFTKKQFEILNSLFLDLDAYCDDIELMDENDIDEKTLRENCKKYLEILLKESPQQQTRNF